MIVSASRRTDIPAFYSDWFMDKIGQGFSYVMNPFNRKQVNKIILTPDTVNCFVFWTKNAAPMMDKLHVLDEKGFKYYFLFTVTPYGRDIEPGIEDKERILDTFVSLSNLIGRKKVVWRYDPILISRRYDKGYHYEMFEKYCERLCGSTEKCVVSFLDMYAKTERNTRDLDIIQPDGKDMNEIAFKLGDIAKRYRIVIETCCEKIDMSHPNIKPGKCIDKELIEWITGRPINAEKDASQREGCGCVKSVDIGQYNTCLHGCAYCYANYSRNGALENMKHHDAGMPFLSGGLKGDETIRIRE